MGAVGYGGAEGNMSKCLHPRRESLRDCADGNRKVARTVSSVPPRIRFFSGAPFAILAPAPGTPPKTRPPPVRSQQPPTPQKP